jgi:uncharacterized protein YndB with AHSA1/START domain
VSRDFEFRHEAVVPVSPEQVWEAIASGPGITSWFVGRTTVEDGVVRTEFGDGWMPAGVVSVSERPHRFAFGSEPGPDGRFVASEFLVEGRDGAATVLRAVNSGFLPGDDWAGEYEAMGLGNAMFFATLVEYLTHFRGRVGRPVTVFGPAVSWESLRERLGVGAGDERVFFVNADTLGLRTPLGLYRYLKGFHGGMVVSHVLFGEVCEFPTEIG